MHHTTFNEQQQKKRPHTNMRTTKLASFCVHACLACQKRRKEKAKKKKDK